MKKSSRDLLNKIKDEISNINCRGTGLSLEKITLESKGLAYFVALNDGFGGCLNGLWTEDFFQRMYDQTKGFSQGLAWKR